jgi:multisubunit Na+/H+ antiporter MnhB subunit
MPRRKSGRWSTSAKHGLLAIVKLIAIVALPFIAYVRASVFFYEHGAPTWGAIAGGVLLTLSLVALYASRLVSQLKGRARVRQLARWIAVPVAAAWCLSALFYLARVNAKSDEVHGYFLSVHPILRVALSTVILVDADLVITDMARVPVDYARMGLQVNDRTMHYMQRDGWVHAVDLRTHGRSEIANRAVQLYFWGMGFSTLRHVGTADHLHVQLRHAQAT